jgi:signal peptidase I
VGRCGAVSECSTRSLDWSIMSTSVETNNSEQRVERALPPAVVGLSRWVRDVLISLAIAGFIIVFLYQPVKVEGTSMLPGLVDQERIFINKFVYHFETINRGDIVVFHYPYDPSKSYIKRVIGLPGDRIEIVDGQVFVNGKALRERYIPPQYEDGRSYPETVVPAQHYFLLGDHRNLSNDSRDFGPVDESFIYGKAVFVYWPMDKVGTLH